MNQDQSIVPGITLTASGQAEIDPMAAEQLIELAIELEGPTALPVDVQHVVAALVLASRNGEIESSTPLNSKDQQLTNILIPHIQSVFANFGGKVGRDD